MKRFAIPVVRQTSARPAPIACLWPLAYKGILRPTNPRIGMNHVALSNALKRFCVLFLRLVALFFLIYAVQYWIRIIGYYDGPQYRFDTMSTAWKTAVAILAVLCPLTALGLWGVFSWGVVVWIAAALIELLMYAVYPEVFGANSTRVTFHLATLAMYLVYVCAQQLLAWQASKQA